MPKKNLKVKIAIFVGLILLILATIAVANFLNTLAPSSQITGPAILLAMVAMLLTMVSLIILLVAKIQGKSITLPSLPQLSSLGKIPWKIVLTVAGVALVGFLIFSNWSKITHIGTGAVVTAPKQEKWLWGLHREHDPRNREPYKLEWENEAIIIENTSDSFIIDTICHGKTVRHMWNKKLEDKGTWYEEVSGDGGTWWLRKVSPTRYEGEYTDGEPSHQILKLWLRRTQ